MHWIADTVCVPDVAPPGGSGTTSLAVQVVGENVPSPICTPSHEKTALPVHVGPRM